jgi:hypothetical protein
MSMTVRQAAKHANVAKPPHFDKAGATGSLQAAALPAGGHLSAQAGFRDGDKVEGMKKGFYTIMAAQFFRRWPTMRCSLPPLPFSLNCIPRSG